MMKNRKGSSLVLVLMVFSVLMVLSTFIVGFMVTENKQSLYHQHKTQAYYIARGGAVAVEAAILKMDEAQIDKLNKELDKGEVEIDEISIDGNIANVVVKRDGDKLNIESVASVRDVVEKVTKVMETETISTGSIEIDLAIFSHGDIIFDNGTINGDIGTNGDIRIINDSNPTIGGKAFMTTSGEFDGPSWWLSKNWSEDREERRTSEIKYLLPVFPNFPSNLDKKDNIKTAYDNTNPIIKENGFYEQIEIESDRSMTIDATSKEITLLIKTLKIPQGTVRIIGNNKVNIYVENLNISGGSKINYIDSNPGNPRNLTIYYNGNSELKVSGSQRISGNVYVEKANVNVTAGGAILGNIISGGNRVTINGGASIHTGLIYAPNSDVILSEGGSVFGAVISNTFKMSGGAKLEFKPENIDTSLINFESSTSSSIKYKPGYFK